MKLRTKVILPILIMIFSIIGLYATINTIRTQRLLSDELEQQINWIHAYGVQSYLRVPENAYAVVEMIRGIVVDLAERGASRSEVLEIMGSAVADQQRVLGVWVAWEPNAYDGADRTFAGVSPYTERGHFASYLYRTDGNSLEIAPLNDYRNQSWYRMPLATAQPYLSEPVQYDVTDRDVISLTAALPIHRDEAITAAVQDLSSIKEMNGVIHEIAARTNHAVHERSH